jgi:hypothetical protein
VRRGLKKAIIVVAQAFGEVADIGWIAVLVPMAVLVTVGQVDGMRAGGCDVGCSAATF